MSRIRAAIEAEYRYQRVHIEISCASGDTQETGAKFTFRIAVAKGAFALKVGISGKREGVGLTHQPFALSRDA